MWLPNRQKKKNGFMWKYTNCGWSQAPSFRENKQEEVFSRCLRAGVIDVNGGGWVGISYAITMLWQWLWNRLIEQSGCDDDWQLKNCFEQDSVFHHWAKMGGKVV